MNDNGSSISMETDGNDQVGVDLQSAVEQLQQAITSLQAQFDTVAKAAGIDTGEQGENQQEEAQETPDQEQQEDASEAAPQPQGKAPGLAAFMSAPSKRHL